MRAKFVNIEEGVGDKYIENKYGIKSEFSDNDNIYNQSKLKNGIKPIGYAKNPYNKESFPVYKNPASLFNFDPSVKAIGSSNGDFYVTSNGGGIIHGWIADDIGLAKYNGDNGVYDRQDEFVTLVRINNTNKFGLSDTYLSFMDKKPKIAISLLRKLKKTHPQYDFYFCYYDKIDLNNPNKNRIK